MIAKFGNLKFFPLDAVDLEKHPLRRFCRVFNRYVKVFQLDYFPEIKGFETVYIPEDKSAGYRGIVVRARQLGIKTVVVQHGIPFHKGGYVPLLADYFMCWPEHRLKFIDWGIREDRLIVFEPKPPKKLKFIEGVEAVLFLIVPIMGSNSKHYYDDDKLLVDKGEIMDKVREIAERERNLWVKPHPKHYHAIKHDLERYAKGFGYKITWERAEDLIHSAKRVYCFWDCTTVKDAQVQGKEPIIING